MSAVLTLTDVLSQSLAPHGFHTHWRSGMSKLGCVAFWRRCTLNSNRAVALIQRPEGDFDVGLYCQKMKWRLLWLTRFCPLFYEVGLQIVLCGDGLERAIGSVAELRNYVDWSSNQFVVLQSLFVVDTASRRYVAVRTRDQVITGPFQDSIAHGIASAGFTWMGTD